MQLPHLFPHLSIGRWAEDKAHQFLCQRGLQLVQRNYRCKAGEIDLIMRQQQTLVFVEVRYRKHQQYGGAAASIDSRKQQHIAMAAQHYLQTHRHAQHYTCRFDVVLIEGTGAEPTIQWLSDAFRL